MDADRDLALLEIHALLRGRAGLDAESLGAGAVAQAVRKMPIPPGTVDGVEFQDLLDELLVPETWFFRDVLPFRLLRDFADQWRRQSRAGVFRALSVGCSTGEEAYSMAMVLCDAGLEMPRFNVLGVDLSRRALRAAEEAVYGERSFREEDAVAAALRDRFCARSGGRWSVREELRRSVRFRHGNLAAEGFFAEEPPFDAVFCRNVLIYFHAEARRVALANLGRLLAPGGMLVCGHAEARALAEGGFRSCSPECPLAFSRSDEQVAGQATVRVYPESGTVPAAAPPEAEKAAPERRVRRISAAPRRETARPAAVAATFDERALLHAARAAADSGRLTDAEALCRQVLSGNPASVEGHYLLGLAHQAQGDDDKARQLYEKALYLDPKHYEAIVHLMLLAEKRGQRGRAENYRRRARACAPKEAP